MNLAVALLLLLPTDVSVSPDESRPAVGVRVVEEFEGPPTASLHSGGTDPSSEPGIASPAARPSIPDRCFVDLSDPNYRCALPSEFGDDPAQPVADEPEAPQVTPGRVLTAVREIGLPRLRLSVQPGGETLVNLDTILHTTEPDFARSISLLGSSVELEASPTTYTWHHGDGTSQRTTTPGAPYPSKDVVHRYERPARGVTLRVDATYRVRFRVDGGPWQTLAETITATGPSTTIDVREARPVLTAR